MTNGFNLCRSRCLVLVYYSLFKVILINGLREPRTCRTFVVYNGNREFVYWSKDARQVKTAAGKDFTIAFCMFRTTT